MSARRRVIVRLGASADGYIARTDGDIEWLTSRPKPAGFYGMGDFMKSVDTCLLGRKTYEAALALGGKFDARKNRTIVCSRHPRPSDAPAGVEFVGGDVGAFVNELRQQPGKDIWLMGGGDLIASLLDAAAIDELVVTMMPILLGEGIPLFARRGGDVPLHLVGVERFEDDVVQLRYRI